MRQLIITFCVIADLVLSGCTPGRNGTKVTIAYRDGTEEVVMCEDAWTREHMFHDQDILVLCFVGGTMKQVPVDAIKSWKKEVPE